ncbi:MAG: type VI secretion system baseplate subunit TssK, partial [Desulfobacterales bacterium]|nr:type VI secretion system baseplate subunit TssK [Desulfobacterales bacterium]
GGNVTTLTGTRTLTGVNTRFISPAATEEVRDLHESGPSAQVRRLKYALKILWETEKDFFGDYETIPIAQLERQGEEVVLCRQFHPAEPESSMPQRPTGKDTSRRSATRSHRADTSSKAFKRDRGIHTAEFGSRDMVYLLALRSLNRYIPQLFHLTESTGPSLDGLRAAQAAHR